MTEGGEAIADVDDAVGALAYFVGAEPSRSHGPTPRRRGQLQVLYKHPPTNSAERHLRGDSRKDAPTGVAEPSRVLRRL
jgi:hypothetical protein